MIQYPHRYLYVFLSSSRWNSTHVDEAADVPVNLACILNSVLQGSKTIDDQAAYASATVTDKNNLEQERRESSVGGNTNFSHLKLQLQAHLMPETIVVFLWAPDLYPLLAHVEGEDQLSMGQEECHEVILPGIRHVKDEAGGCVCPQGQREVGPAEIRSIK